MGPRRAVAQVRGASVPTVAAGRVQSPCRRGPGIHRCLVVGGRRVKRGEIWTASSGRDYAGKPRPVVIVQDDRFGETNSITICVFTTDPTDAPLFRIAVEPSATNGLAAVSRLMVD